MVTVLGQTTKVDGNQAKRRRGQFSLVIELDTPRRAWPLGRVTEVYPGRDGYVRTVKVKMHGKEYVRPITKICPLELQF